VNRGNQARDEIYLEYILLGHLVKVTAVDAATGTEVSVAGPRTASQQDLAKIAVAKLHRRLGKRTG